VPRRASKADRGRAQEGESRSSPTGGGAARRPRIGIAAGIGARAALAVALAAPAARGRAQSLEEELRGVPAGTLAKEARATGDAARGAVLFFQPQMACSKCHATGDADAPSIGPDLAGPNPSASDEFLVDAVLLPSKVIQDGYRPVSVVTADGGVREGLLAERTAERLVLRDPGRGGALVTLPARDVVQVTESAVSIMPSGQADALASRQQFLDLIRYLIEVRDGGAARARELKPSSALLAPAPPEYEQHLDHAGLLRAWDAESLRRGEAIYRRVCVNCHGTREQPGTLPTSLRFAEGRFKNGSDPLAMYRTLTRGFGMMTAQSWMVPSQKYDVIHYIREAYLRPFNPSQYVTVDDAYLAALPKGDTRGPAPSAIEPWSAMDYGPSLTHTYEVPGPSTRFVDLNFAYKGIAVRLDPGPGGVSRGRHWLIFDHDTMRVAAAWSAGAKDGEGRNFIDWRGIQFNGEHQVHPTVSGDLAFSNSTGPGFADPADGSFRDDRRVEGRDGRRYGPLPRDWARYRGLYHHGQQVIVSYTVGTTDVLESPGLQLPDEAPQTPLFLRTFNVGARAHDLVLQVAENGDAGAELATLEGGNSSIVRLGAAAATADAGAAERRLVFDGGTYVEVAHDPALDLTGRDFSIAARFRTTRGGTLLALVAPGPEWRPDGQTLFVRDGRLCFDIGWVGVVTSRTRVDDGAWHEVAMEWRKSDHRVQLRVDGALDAEGALAAKAALPDGVVRIGFTAPDFPRPDSFFQGDLDEVRIRRGDELVARWALAAADHRRVVDATGHGRTGEVRRGEPRPAFQVHPLLAGVSPRATPAEWSAQDGRLRLRIAAGTTPLRFTVWTAAAPPGATAPIDPWIPAADADLAALTHGGPARWPQRLETLAARGPDDGPFAVDALTAPESNPWLAQTRFTGLDFLADGRIAVCSWDGDVWLVELSDARPADGGPAPATILRWQRIASGLFQPLGLKVVDGRIHVLCRDQLVVLHDLNGDGETDFYECLNNDHQVTDHFHEFAMGLQTDAAGNFYYAKGGRHGLPAVVPQHGTLLRVSPDGSRTDILATGLRAPNGVCVNPDGSFLVTDQEGFWTPKNRINWVTLDPSGRPKFYGNMLGYSDVTDPSDSAMEQPLCWITNAMDRSPAEPLWVEGDRLGPLKGALLNLSYGYGKVYLVLHEEVRGVRQGGVIELPMPPFPTGIMRGRFHPIDRQLYLCGMFAWAGDATHPGGLYRMRATGKPLHLPLELHAVRAGLTLTFTEPLDRASLDPKSVAVKTWSLRRSANYGSEHLGEKPLEVRGLSLSSDGRTLRIDLPDLRPTWCMEIRYALRAENGDPVGGVIHNTIHEVGD
jgi:putative heme-binding domain-containing protein